MSDVLIVEDDLQLREMLCYFLKNVEGYSVDCSSSGEGAAEIIMDQAPKLVLLDIQLPHTSGLSVLESLRQQGSTIPVIIMTANDNEITETNALTIGANDYITKPVRTNALRERIRKILEQKPSIHSRVEEELIFRLCPRNSTLQFKHITVPLIPSEFELLELLAKADEPMPVHELFQHIHGFPYHIEDRSIYMRVSTLRKKLSAYLPDMELIKNKRSRGFYLNYQVVVR